MKDWLKQRSTQLGIALVVITVLGVLAQYGKIGAEWPAMASALAAMLGLAVNDKGVKPSAKTEKASKNGQLLGLVLICTVSSACFYTSCASIPLSPALAKSAATVGCIALQASGCFDDVQSAFPGLNSQTCNQVIGTAIDVAVEVKKNFETLPKEEAAAKSVDPVLSIADQVNTENWDPLAVKPEALDPDASCRKVARALGVK